MPSPSLFVDALPGTAQVYLVAGALTTVALLAGLVLLAVAIRGEDAPTKLGVRAPGPIARRVRHMLNLHIYTGGDVPYGRSRGRGPTAGYEDHDPRVSRPRRYHGPA